MNTQLVFLCIDDTIVPKFGKKFEDVLKLFDHAVHNGSDYLNGHCFVSLMLCVPVWYKYKIVYQSVPLSYRMWQKKESRLELAASMVRQVMPELREKKNVIILCDRWYTKSSLVSVADEYPNPDLIGNAGYDSVLYDPAPQPTGRREVPACVTATEKDGGSRRMFFSAIFPEELQIFCAWQEKEPLNQIGSS